MTNEMMKAGILYGIDDLRIEDTKRPRIGPNEVLVKIKAAMTCGTDLKILKRGYVDKVIKLPAVFGHEWAGDVIEAGDYVEWPKKGMRIRAGNSAPCLQCVMCRKGKFNLCEDMLWLWGAYAEYIRVPSRTLLVNTQEIPANVTYEEAALTEPLACVLHGAEEAQVKIGDSLAIMGAGPIGLLHLLVAKKLGAGKIIVSDLAEERLKIARNLGADETINAGEENVTAKVKQLTDDCGADVVIEAIGLPTTWEQALKMVRKGGVVLEFGGCPPRTKIQVDTELLHYDEVTVKGSFHATPTHFKKALNLISSGVLNVKPVITKKMPLGQLHEAFERLATAKSEIKIAIIP